MDIANGANGAHQYNPNFRIAIKNIAGQVLTQFEEVNSKSKQKLDLEWTVNGLGKMKIAKIKFKFPHVNKKPL